MHYQLKLIFFFLSNIYFLHCSTQNIILSTEDIDNYWNAYDKLSTAINNKDSTQIFQDYYINKATKAFKKLIESRGYTAEQYISNIRKYPKFWISLRMTTSKQKINGLAIEKIYRVFDSTFSRFKSPEIYIGMGCFSSGGTTTKNKLLIATEIAGADSTIDLSELPIYFRNILGNNNIVSYIAHETVHTIQSGFPINEIFKLLKYKRLNLLNMAITEGSADFITTTLIGLNINKNSYLYGEKNEAALWADFKRSYIKEPFNYSDWLYNFKHIKGKPADLGYYIGYKITEAYYNKMENKKSALRSILKRGRYKKIFYKSGYNPIPS